MDEVRGEDELRARRRAAAERLRGMFAHVAPGRSLADELVAERHAEAGAGERAERSDEPGRETDSARRMERRGPREKARRVGSE